MFALCRQNCCASGANELDVHDLESGAASGKKAGNKWDKEGGSGNAQNQQPRIMGKKKPPEDLAVPPVPEGWGVAWSNTKHRFFYVDKATKVTQWTHPDPDMIREWKEQQKENQRN